MDIHGEKYQIEVRVGTHFYASHGLPMRPEMHNHRWEVEFTVAGPLNPETGMVVDMLVLSEFFDPYVKPLDGYNLHEYPGFNEGPPLIQLTAEQPTCDTLAHYFLWKILPDFKKHPEFEGLRITLLSVSTAEPEDGAEPWGYAQIRLG